MSAYQALNNFDPQDKKNLGFKKPTHLFKIYLARQYAKFYPRELFTLVTGSLGKTTCVTACLAVLSAKYNTLSTKLDSTLLDIPETLLKISPKTKKVILEMGIENIGEMDFYLSLVQPNTAIVTRITHDFSEYLGGLDKIIEETGKLISKLDSKGVAILNFDDPSSKKLAKDCKGTVVFFGTNPDNCLVWAGNIKIENYRTTFELNLGVERVKVNLQLCGLHQIYPCLSAAALGVVNNIPLTKIKLALESITPLEHRMQVLLGANDSIVLDDTTNSSPAALEGAIDTLLQISARRRILVLGEMRNLGSYSDDLHRQLAAKIFKEKIDLIFLGQGISQVLTDELKDLGFWEERMESNLQNSQIVSKLLKILRKGDLVLIKGAYATRLDEVVKRISKKV